MNIIDNEKKIIQRYEKIDYISTKLFKRKKYKKYFLYRTSLFFIPMKSRLIWILAILGSLTLTYLDITK